MSDIQTFEALVGEIPKIHPFPIPTHIQIYYNENTYKQLCKMETFYNFKIRELEEEIKKLRYDTVPIIREVEQENSRLKSKNNDLMAKINLIEQVITEGAYKIRLKAKKELKDE